MKKVEPHLEFLLEEKSAFLEGTLESSFSPTFFCHVNLRKRRMMLHLMRQTELLRPWIALHTREAGYNWVPVQPTTVKLLVHLMRADAASSFVISDFRKREMDFRSPKIISATTEGMW